MVDSSCCNIAHLVHHPGEQGNVGFMLDTDAAAAAAAATAAAAAAATVGSVTDVAAGAGARGETGAHHVSHLDPPPDRSDRPCPQSSPL